MQPGHHPTRAMKTTESAPPAAARSTTTDSASPPAFVKSRNDVGRLVRAMGHSWRGVCAAWRHEAAFRLEVMLGLPLLAVAGWAAPGRWQALALVLSVLVVWIVELLNSAVEALADAVSTDHHPLIGRAKDMGSAAVTLSLVVLVLTWGVVFWP